MATLSPVTLTKVAITNIHTAQGASMNLRRRFSVLLAIASFFTAVSFAQQVKTDYDRNADFNQYKTFSWENVHTENPLWVDRIKSAVNSALAAKDWTLVGSGGSVSIMALEMNQTHQTLNTYYDGFGGGLAGEDGEGEASEMPRQQLHL
jgi:hypothetical protein